MERLTGRGGPFVPVSSGAGPPRDVAGERAAAVKRSTAVDVDDVVLRADIGAFEGTEEVLGNADRDREVRSGGAEYRRKVAVVPSARCPDGRRAAECGKRDRGKRRPEQQLQSWLPHLISPIVGVIHYLPPLMISRSTASARHRSSAALSIGT